MGNIDLNEQKNYKNCSKKAHNLYVCKPPINTVVINRLDHYEEVKKLGNKAYYTIHDLEQYKEANNSKLQYIINLVNQGVAKRVTETTPFVISDTLGELNVISETELFRNYSYIQNNSNIPLNKTLIESRQKNGYLDWMLISYTNRYVQEKACFIPQSQKGSIRTKEGIIKYNEIGLNHGKGDFIVCSMLMNGQANLADMRVVNGEVFATTYNNKGWSEHIKNVNTVLIEKLPNLLVDMGNKEENREEFENFYKGFVDIISNIVDVIEDKSCKNQNKILKITGDNDNYLVLHFKLENGKARLSGRSNKISLDSKYELTKEGIEKSVKDILVKLRVSPLRNRLKTLGIYIQSKNKDYKITKITFNSLNVGFTLKFVLNNAYLFTYGINTSNNCMSFLYVKDNKYQELEYHFKDVIQEDYEEGIYQHINYIIEQENSSWKGIFNELKNGIKRAGFSGLVYNKGDNYYHFTVNKKYTFELESYTESNFIFICKQIDKRGYETDKLVLDRSKEYKSQVELYINNLLIEQENKSRIVNINNHKNRLLNELDKVIQEYEELIYSDEIQKKLHKYREEDGNTEFLYKLFLSASEYLDERLYETTFSNEYYSVSAFSLDDEVYLYAKEDENGCSIRLKEGNNFLVLYDCGESRGYFDLTKEDAKLFLSSIMKSGLELPRWVSEFDYYDLSLDFWYSMNEIYEFLVECKQEIETNGELSYDSYEKLEQLVKAPNSKISINEDDLGLYEKKQETVEVRMKKAIKKENEDELLSLFDGSF